ncbi:hypothetical protein AZI85_14725 [Bdellovibrio bacteriovorus]|uniref:Uncharacterized protein n=1 Tax=Bdellovibrio bacteriovorus TaxID=959 RepID=A0A150WU06_BDEBC|nr:hypothetical protein AZI85_14725 [Bdellovibrio bacteriovorus]
MFLASLETRFFFLASCSLCSQVASFASIVEGIGLGPSWPSVLWTAFGAFEDASCVVDDKNSRKLFLCVSPEGVEGRSPKQPLLSAPVAFREL